MDRPPRKRSRFALWYESTPRPQYFLIALIAALFAPSLAGDFMVDDHRMLRVFREYREGLRPSPGAYQFLPGGEQNRIERAAGWYPWWLQDTFKYKHFRPLSERMLYAEYLLFGENPVGYRLVGIALYIAGVLLVLQLFRLVGGDERLARWGAIIFTVASCHAIPVVFISAHCDIIALALSVAAAILATRYLYEGSPVALVGSLFFFVAGLFSKEAVLPFVLWPICAWLLVRREHGTARSARVIAGCWFMLGIAWFALYLTTNCGGNGAPMLDPIAAPLQYLRAAPYRALLLLTAWIIPINPFLLEFQIGRGDLQLYFAIAGALALTAVAMMFLIHHRRQRGLAAMALWSVLFLPILVCTPPDDRVMVLPSVGLAFLAAAWLTRPHDNGSHRLRPLPLMLFIVTQLLTSAATGHIMNYMERCAQDNLRTMLATFHRPPLPGDEIFVVNSRFSYDGLFLQDRFRRVHPDPPVGVRLLTDAADPVVTRVDARTLRLEAADTRFLQNFLGRMGSQRDLPRKIGDESDAGPFTCRITEADERGAKSIEIEFDQPLESDAYRFIWVEPDGAPRPLSPPPPALETPRAGASTPAPSGDVTQQREKLGPDGRQRRVWTVKLLANGQEVEHGPWSAFYENGLLYLDGQYLDGERHGVWTTYHPNGQHRGIGTFDRGRKTGTWTHWDDQGRKRREYLCADDDYHGIWTEWDEQGRIVERGAYDHGQKHGDWIKRDANGAIVETRWDHGREAGVATTQTQK
jgi:MORN repeat protein